MITSTRLIVKRDEDDHNNFIFILESVNLKYLVRRVKRSQTFSSQIVLVIYLVITYKSTM